MAASRDAAGSAEHLALVGRVSTWLAKAGVANSGMAVDFADIIAAAGRVAELLAATIGCDPSVPDDADRALTSITEMHAWLFTEMRPHLETLEQSWSTLEGRLEDLSNEN